jgi:single-strand DNA-binding protein
MERKGYLYLNEVKITGRVAGELSFKKFDSGGGVVEFPIAHNRRYQKDGEWKEETSFFRVKAYNNLAERLREKLSKGDFVLVEGRLQEDTWETDDGKRSMVRIIADMVHLVFPYEGQNQVEERLKGRTKNSKKTGKEG